MQIFKFSKEIVKLPKLTVGGVSETIACEISKENVERDCEQIEQAFQKKEKKIVVTEAPGKKAEKISFAISKETILEEC